jgi:hypothetical protein
MINSQKINAAISACALLSTVLMGSASFAQDAVGRNSAIQGTVTIQSVGQDIRSAAVKDDIFLGDDIGSDVDSRIRMATECQRVSKKVCFGSCRAMFPRLIRKMLN